MVKAGKVFGFVLVIRFWVAITVFIPSAFLKEQHPLQLQRILFPFLLPLYLRTSHDANCNASTGDSERSSCP